MSETILPYTPEPLLTNDLIRAEALKLPQETEPVLYFDKGVQFARNFYEARRGGDYVKGVADGTRLANDEYRNAAEQSERDKSPWPCDNNRGCPCYYGVGGSCKCSHGSDDHDDCSSGVIHCHATIQANGEE